MIGRVHQSLIDIYSITNGLGELKGNSKQDGHEKVKKEFKMTNGRDLSFEKPITIGVQF